MDPFSRGKLRKLIERRAKLCLSIFMPCDPMPVGARQNQIRYVNLLKQAEERLQAAGRSPKEVRQILQAAQKLSGDSSFWREPCKGLALFAAFDLFECYRLPLTPEELLVVAEHAHVTPLLPLLGEDGRYYVLALSQNAIKLFHGSRDSFREIQVDEVPHSLAEALKYDQIEKDVGFRGSARSGGGRWAARFFGGTAGPDRSKDRLLQFFQQIDQGLRSLLRGEEAPLILAGVDYLFPLYREANSYPHLLVEGIPGNPDRLSPHTLQQRAWEILRPHLKRPLNEAAAFYLQHAETERSSTLLEEILPASAAGRVELLFVALGLHHWGTFDPTTGEIQKSPEEETGSEDLINIAAVHTLLASGTVHAVPPGRMPAEASLAAVFRY